MEPVAVVDLDVDPVRSPTGEDHLSVGGGELLGAGAGRNVDAGVVLPEVLGDDAVRRPEEPDDLLTASAGIGGGRRPRQGIDIDVRRQAICGSTLVMAQRRNRTRLGGRHRIAKSRLAQPGPHERRAAGGYLRLGDRVLECKRRQQKDKHRQGERPAVGGQSWDSPCQNWGSLADFWSRRQTAHHRLHSLRDLSRTLLASVPVLTDFSVCPFDGLQCVVVLGVEMADCPALAAEDHRLGLGPEVVVDGAVEELAVGHAGGRKRYVFAANEVVDGVDAAQVLEAGGPRLLLVIPRAQPQTTLQVTAEALERTGREYRLW